MPLNAGRAAYECRSLQVEGNEFFIVATRVSKFKGLAHSGQVLHWRQGTVTVELF